MASAADSPLQFIRSHAFLANHLVERSSSDHRLATGLEILFPRGKTFFFTNRFYFWLELMMWLVQTFCFHRQLLKTNDQERIRPNSIQMSSGARQNW